MWKAAAGQVQDPWRASTGMTVAQAIAAGSAETPQDSLEAPAAGQLLSGAGMWAPCSFPPWCPVGAAEGMGLGSSLH